MEPPVRIRYDFSGPFDQLLTLKVYTTLNLNNIVFFFFKKYLSISSQNYEKYEFWRLILLSHEY